MSDWRTTGHFLSTVGRSSSKGSGQSLENYFLQILGCFQGEESEMIFNSKVFRNENVNFFRPKCSPPSAAVSCPAPNALRGLNGTPKWSIAKIWCIGCLLDSTTRLVMFAATFSLVAIKRQRSERVRAASTAWSCLLLPHSSATACWPGSGRSRASRTRSW